MARAPSANDEIPASVNTMEARLDAKTSMAKKATNLIGE